jgi:hypothetical protein
MVSLIKKVIEVSDKCQRPGCGGTIIDDGDGFAVCNLCSRPPIIPDKPDSVTKSSENVIEAGKNVTGNTQPESKPKPDIPKKHAERAKWLKEHRAEILDVIYKEGAEAAMAKWDLPRKSVAQLIRAAGLRAQKTFLPPPRIKERAPTFATLPPIEKIQTPVTYLITYWRKRAGNKNTSDSERLIMNLTADVLDKFSK